MQRLWSRPNEAPRRHLRGGKTEVVATQAGHMPKEEYPELEKGYSIFFDRLEAHSERRAACGHIRGLFVDADFSWPGSVSHSPVKPQWLAARVVNVEREADREGSSDGLLLDRNE